MNQKVVNQIRASRYKSVREQEFQPLFECYVEGWEKAFDKKEEDCPYPDNSPKAECWLSGWNDSRCEP